MQRKVRSFHSRGMSYRQMGEQLGIPAATVAHSTRYEGAWRPTFEALARLRFEPPEPTSRVDPTGTARRLGALMRDGFPAKFLAPEMGYNPANLYRLYRPEGRSYVLYETAEQVIALYDRFEGRKPEEFGISRYGVSRARAYAAKRGDAPSHCWDPDTIDDPKAFPEWTGSCGTPQGLRIHYRDGIPTCQPCLDSRFQGEGEKAPRVDGAKLRAARKAAGMSVAGFARRVGCDTSAVYYWETGRSAPRNQQTVDKIVTALKIGEEDICGDL